MALCIGRRLGVVPRGGGLSRQAPIKLLLLGAALAAGATHADEVAAVSRQAQEARSAGLCVHLGVTDGRLEATLAAGGRLLVHGLALDEGAVRTARDGIRAQGVYGLASAEQAISLNPLPYADNLVNLLIADMDALGEKAPPEKEILRVLTPNGIAFLKKSGKWTQTSKPRPKEMDDWSQYYRDSSMNPVSRDTLVAPSSSVKWIANYFERGGAHNSNSGVIISGGKAVYVYRNDSRQGNAILTVRDAYNGIRVWSTRIAQDLVKQSLLVVDDVIYCVKDEKGFLVAIDANSGTLLRTYDQGAKAVNPHNMPLLSLPTVYHDGLLLQAGGDTLYALDAVTGRLKWKHTIPGKIVFYPAVGGEKIFLAFGPEPYNAWRVPSNKTEGVVALSLDKGTEIWRNGDTANDPFAQLAYHDGTLAVISWTGIGSRAKNNRLICIDAATGRTRWAREYAGGQDNPGPSAVAMFRNGELQAGMLDGFVAYDPVSGEVQRKVANRIPRVSSFQCNASRATLSYLMTYSTVFTDNKGTAVRKFITRSTCGTGMFPANGMVYSTTNYCGCHTMLRGHMALASELPGEPTPDRKRLQTGMAADFADPTLWPKPDEWPAFMGGSERHCTTKGSLGKNLKLLWQVRVTEGQRFPDSSLVGDWLENDQNPGPALPPIVAEGLVVIATPESHTLHAFEAATGKPTWKFVAGGRVGTPTLYGGLCLFGSHDGWVYALRATDGRLAWRFLAAHNQRKMSAYSQLESPWPVASTVTILDGAAFVAAGRHPQADGGIQVYRLDPVSGNVHWKSVWTGPATDPLGDTGNSVINDVLVSDGKLLYLKALALNPATGQFGERVRRKGSRSDVLIFADKSEVPVARYPASRWGLITASPVGFGGNLNATHWALAGGKAYAHRAGVWNNPLQTKYLSCWADTVFSLDATKEKPVWLNDATRDSNRGKAEVNALVVAGDKVLVAGRDLARGYVEMFDAADGAKMGALDLPLPPVEKGLAVAYGRLYVSLRDGTLVCFGD